MESARKFKIIVNSKECGTCSGATPSAIAKKVVKKLCGTSSKVVKFSLKECKRGCERVCGPYQGRMEKLDRPYKRGGKTITHRVVCGKVRKMRGGVNNWEDLESFKKNEGDSEFKLRIIDNMFPIIYFGGNDNSFKYILFVDNHFCHKYIAQINEDGTKVSIIFSFRIPNYDFIYNNYDLKQNLKKLKDYVDNILKDNRIVNPLRSYLDMLLTEINERNKKNRAQRNEKYQNYMRNQRPPNTYGNTN